MSFFVARTLCEQIKRLEVYRKMAVDGGYAQTVAIIDGLIRRKQVAMLVELSNRAPNHELRWDQRNSTLITE